MMAHARSWFAAAALAALWLLPEPANAGCYDPAQTQVTPVSSASVSPPPTVSRACPIHVLVADRHEYTVAITSGGRAIETESTDMGTVEAITQMDGRFTPHAVDCCERTETTVVYRRVILRPLELLPAASLIEVDVTSSGGAWPYRGTFWTNESTESTGCPDAPTPEPLACRECDFSGIPRCDEIDGGSGVDAGAPDDEGAGRASCSLSGPEPSRGRSLLGLVALALTAATLRRRHTSLPGGPRA
jgi:hypothetical protein